MYITLRQCFCPSRNLETYVVPPTIFFSPPFLFSSLSLSCLPGSDRDGRPVIVISACRLPPSYAINHDVLLRLIHHLMRNYLTLYFICICHQSRRPTQVNSPPPTSCVPHYLTLYFSCICHQSRRPTQVNSPPHV